MDNKFLRDFMKTQATLIETTVPERKGKKPKHGTADGKPSFPEGEGLEKFFQKEKPPKKELLEYFKNRIAQLIAEDP
jgi:hypothetical protein